MVSTLFTVVGQPKTPTSAGKGGFNRGLPALPSRDSIKDCKSTKWRVEHFAVVVFALSNCKLFFLIFVKHRSHFNNKLARMPPETILRQLSPNACQWNVVRKCWRTRLALPNCHTKIPGKFVLCLPFLLRRCMLQLRGAWTRRNHNPNCTRSCQLNPPCRPANQHKYCASFNRQREDTNW